MSLKNYYDLIAISASARLAVLSAPFCASGVTPAELFSRRTVGSAVTTVGFCRSSMS